MEKFLDIELELGHPIVMCMLHFTTDRTVVSFIMSMAID